MKLSVSTICLLAWFFLFFGGMTLVTKTTGRVPPYGAGITGIFAILSSLFLMLDVWNYKGRILPVLIVLSLSSSTCFAQTLFELERAKAAGAEFVAIVYPIDIPGPQPEPSPSPSGQDCGTCGGSGKVRSGDGLSWMNCQTCGGSGKITKSENKPSRVSASSTKTSTRSEPSTAVSPWIDGILSVDGGVSNIPDNGKPLAIFYTGDFCSACKKFEKEVLQDFRVSQYLRNRFNCVKVNFSNFEAASVIATGIDTIPQFYILPPNLSFKYGEKFSEWSRDPHQFVLQLQDCLKEMGEKDVKHIQSRNDRKSLVRFANSNHQDDEFKITQVQYGSAGGQPMAYQQPVQVYSYGSAGGSYQQPVQSYPVQSYGSAGDGYQQPVQVYQQYQYQQPVQSYPVQYYGNPYYYSPGVSAGVRINNWGVGVRCGPGGCF